MKKYLPAIKPSPIIEKVPLTYPIEEIYGHFSELPNTSFLNSPSGTDTGRYSFIGIEPFVLLRSKKRNIELRFNGHKLLTREDPFEYLDSIIRTYRITNPTPLPFVGGAIGYLSYDLKDLLEKLPQKAKDDLNLADMRFAFYRVLLIHDKLEPDQLYISVIDLDSGNHIKAGQLMKKMRSIIRSLPKKTRPVSKKGSRKPVLRSNFSKAAYMRSVEKIIDYIYAGDIYQACLSQRFETEWLHSPYELYRRLNEINPAPFSAYLNFEKSGIISSSPELFLKVKDNIVETRPMKGTRPRGSHPKEDKKLRDELKKSRKDDAELAMITDLERNDLGKISKPGSVRVAEHRRIETYPTVFQTISVVKSELEPNTGMTDIIKAAFPSGSISGCPKIRAMEIIDELEPTRRGVYTGSIGYISFHDTMQLNVAIRTMITQNQKVYFQTGGGIVADSDPESEYQETLDKARAMMESLGVGDLEATK